MNDIIEKFKNMPPWVWGVAAVGVVATAASIMATKTETEDAIKEEVYYPAYTEQSGSGFSGSYESAPSGGLSDYDQNLIGQLLVGQDAMYNLINGVIPASSDNDSDTHKSIIGSISNSVVSSDDDENESSKDSNGIFTMTEGSHIYTYQENNGDVTITKDGRVVPKENYKYIPKDAGGTRDDNKTSSSSSSKSSNVKTYVEGGITYTSENGVIKKDGKVVPKENYKYIPSAIGGTRK